MLSIILCPKCSKQYDTDKYIFTEESGTALREVSLELGECEICGTAKETMWRVESKLDPIPLTVWADAIAHVSYTLTDLCGAKWARALTPTLVAQAQKEITTLGVRSDYAALLQELEGDMPRALMLSMFNGSDQFDLMNKPHMTFYRKSVPNGMPCVLHYTPEVEAGMHQVFRDARSAQNTPGSTYWVDIYNDPNEADTFQLHPPTHR